MGQTEPNTVSLPAFLDSPTNWKYENGGQECPSAIPYYEAMGIKCMEADKFLVEAVLPEGWCMESDGGGYWVSVLDTKKKPRFCFFLKMSPWDKDAFTRQKSRYSCRRSWDRSAEYEPDEFVQFKVYDGDDVIYECQPEVIKNNSVAFPYESEEARLKRLEMYDRAKTAEKKQKAECEAYLNSRFPDWKVCLAYWE